MTSTDIAVPRESAEREADAVAAWKARHAAGMAELPADTTVILDIATGNCVHGSSWHTALDAFEARFGSGERRSHSYTVGRPIHIGGGLWRK